MAPLTDNFCMEQLYSIQLQAVCDHHRVFLSFLPVTYGLCMTRVLRNSATYKHALGLLRAMRYKPQQPIQLRFSAAHPRAQCVIERARGLVKGRWRPVYQSSWSDCSQDTWCCCCLCSHAQCVHADGWWSTRGTGGRREWRAVQPRLWPGTWNTGLGGIRKKKQDSCQTPLKSLQEIMTIMRFCR